MEEAINSCAECFLKSRYNRYEMLEDLEEFDNGVRKSEYNYLKKHGLKDKKNGISLGVNFIQGHDSWIGVDFAISADFLPSSRIAIDTTINNVKVKPVRNDGHFFQALSFSASKNINLNQYQYTFSPIIIHSPLHLNLLNFGFLRQIGDPDIHWLYQPSIGFGYNIFSMSYGYNFLFKRPKEYSTEKHLFQFKIAYPIGK